MHQFVHRSPLVLLLGDVTMKLMRERENTRSSGALVCSKINRACFVVVDARRHVHLHLLPHWRCREDWWWERWYRQRREKKKASRQADHVCYFFFLSPQRVICVQFKLATDNKTYSIPLFKHIALIMYTSSSKLTFSSSNHSSMHGKAERNSILRPLAVAALVMSDHLPALIVFTLTPAQSLPSESTVPPFHWVIWSMIQLYLFNLIFKKFAISKHAVRIPANITYKILCLFLRKNNTELIQLQNVVFMHPMQLNHFAFSFLISQKNMYKEAWWKRKILYTQYDRGHSYAHIRIWKLKVHYVDMVQITNLLMSP